MLNSVLKAAAAGEWRAARVPVEESTWRTGADAGADAVYQGAFYAHTIAGHALHSESGQ